MIQTDWTLHLFQAVAASGLFAALCFVLSHVRKTTLADKYGVTWFCFLTGMLYADLKVNWFNLISFEMGSCILVAGLALIASGIYFSIRLTEYSRVRRVSIQEVALLRYRYQELYKKMETPDTTDVPQTLNS